MFGLFPYEGNSMFSKKGGEWAMKEAIDGFFNDSLLLPLGLERGVMRTDIKENDKEYLFEVEIPGVAKENISVEIKEDVLTISVKQEHEKKEEKESYVRRERRYGSYSRSFHIENIVAEAIKAKYDNGILSVTLPKKENKEKPQRSIEIL